MALESLIERIKNQKVIILGFGKEGVSTYRFIRRHFPKMKLVVADRNENLKTDEFADDKCVKFVKGGEYDRNLNQYDLIFKSPGISFNRLDYYVENERITSQTNLFLEYFHEQVVGVTGTKGKSTTASLIYHILQHSRGDVFLAGNIGTPFFDIVEQLTPESLVVAELSAHQLEFTHHSPDYAVLLNIYQEHLDHFNSFNNYQNAKTNIFKFQHAGNFLVYNGDDEYIPGWVKGNQPESDTCVFGTQIHPGLHARCRDHLIRFMDDGEIVDEYDLIDYKNLPGTHNYFNIMAAIAICRRLGVKHKDIMDALLTFKGLPHRIEFIGEFKGIGFYNDSISTIPESAIAAVRALRGVETLILGGYDRGIDYQVLIDFLKETPIRNIAFTGPAGHRIKTLLQDQNALPQDFIETDDFEEIVRFAYGKTPVGGTVLLSPAAASYNQFKNFEERGDTFKQLVINAV